MINKRILTPYEKNQLRKHKVREEKLIATESPVEYVTGIAEFCGSEFFVTPDVLIPRIETEELVDLVVKFASKLWKKTEAINKTAKHTSKKTFQIVDVGTGSGAIAISVAQKLQALGVMFQITAIDISKNALEIANKNLLKNQTKILPIKFIQSDLLSHLNHNNKIDLIIANLPYIPSEIIENLDNSVKDFEPHLALDGGSDGLDLVRKLLKQALTIISDNGRILLELDITHTKDKMNEFSNDWQIEIFKSEFDGVNFASLTKK